MTRRVNVLINRLENEDELNRWYEALKSQIKVWPRSSGLLKSANKEIFDLFADLRFFLTKYANII